MSTSQSDFREALVRHGHLIPSGVRGVYARGGEFEDTVERANAMVTTLCHGDNPTVMRSPPVLNRSHLETSGYIKSFPHLTGSVHSFAGDDRGHRELVRALESGEEWWAQLPGTDLVLTPAACYPVYPALSGTLPEGGRLVDVLSYCFRHEPSDDPARMQAFRMRENVRLADPASIEAWRQVWFERARGYTEALGLETKVELANDPFFGRFGDLLAQSQRNLQLKFEIVTPIVSAEHPTAIISLNYHQDHFGLKFGIQTPDGAPAHTGCVAFGLDRITLALYKTHGLDRAAWPDGPRAALGLAKG